MDEPLEADDFVIAEWTAAGGDPRPQAPLHVHHADDEAWYVLEGRLAFTLGDETVEAAAGEAVCARRGVAHTYWNPAAEPARYLLLMTPRIDALIKAIHASDDRSPDTMRALFAAHESELL
jgi:mannose-6-phosphate isomerase-like protein (cupin superfamily)